MSTIAFDQFALTRIADFARSLSRLHQASRRQIVDDDAIDREFNAVCMSVWGYTTDDFSDDLFSLEDHAWLDSLDEAHARIFAAEQGYDLVDDQGMLTDWWGYCWMILAEKRGLLTPENRAAARASIEEKYLSAPNVIGVIVGRLCFPSLRAQAKQSISPRQERMDCFVAIAPRNDDVERAPLVRFRALRLRH
jgi:hypothetical protein